MGKKKNQSEDILQTLGDFTLKENWDKFFEIRGGDDSFEWYAEWTQLREPLLSQLASPSDVAPENFQILVPGCGNSQMSEYLYDDGYHCVTNIDFSKGVISNMLRRNVRPRPHMRWRVMDMTAMQFMDGTFDAVLDKGGLDALMEPEVGTKLGSQYLSEVKRVLKYGGKFICVTLAESHVLGLLFSKFRYGWKTSLHALPKNPHDKPNLQTFMTVTEKETSTLLHQITSSFDRSFHDCNESQARGLYEALDKENRLRSECCNGSDIMYSLEDLKLGVEGDLVKINPGRRVQCTLGEEGGSQFSYKAVILDARELDVQFSYHCGVFLVPKTRAHEWLFSSEEGQWNVVESSKAARLVMVLLDTSHVDLSMDDIQEDLSPLVKQLAPGNNDIDSQIPFMIAGDGIKHRKILHEVTSPMTGSITVEDVVYEDVGDLVESLNLKFRRLTFKRAESLVQSEGLLIRDETSEKNIGQTARKKSGSSKSKKRGNRRRNDESSDQLKVYHSYLASSYHIGIVSGFVLISSFLERVVTARKTLNVVVVGLGAGLLPMFLHGCMQLLKIEVVELDPMILNLARDFFGFTDDDRLKVHIANGVHFVREVANSTACDEVSVHENGNESDKDGKCVKVDILIIDVDSSDSSSGLTCPAADFVETSFLLTVKDTLAEQGLFVINLVSRSSTVKDMIISRMKEVFTHLFSLQLEEDVNEVLFAFDMQDCISEDQLPEASLQLERILDVKHPEMRKSIIEASKNLKLLK